MPNTANMANHERFMRAALDEARRAAREGNVGVGSVIVRDGAEVARGRNLVPTTGDPTAHAETVALREAAAALGTDDFGRCALYTTFEPCPMCCGAIMVAGVSALIMGGRPGAETRWGGYAPERLLAMADWGDRLEIITGVLTAECEEIHRAQAARRGVGESSSSDCMRKKRIGAKARIEKGGIHK